MEIAKLDETVEVLCKAVKTQEEAGEYENVIELTNALAALITARANFGMSFRVYANGSTSQKRNEFWN